MHVYKCSIHEDNCPPHFLRTGTLVRAQKYQRKFFVNSFRNISKTSLLQIMILHLISDPGPATSGAILYPAQPGGCRHLQHTQVRCSHFYEVCLAEKGAHPQFGVFHTLYGLKGTPNLSQEIIWLILNIECLLLVILIIHFRDTNPSWQHLSVYTL